MECLYGWKFQVFVVSFIWLMTVICTALIATSASIVGQGLAPTAEVVNLPYALVFIGAMLMPPVTAFVRFKTGILHLRTTFFLGFLCGVGGGVMNILALSNESFSLLCLGHTAIGIALGAAQLCQHAASLAAPEDKRSSAIFALLSGGAMGAVVGPELGRVGREAVDDQPLFLGSYIIMTSMFGFSTVLLILVRSEEQVDDEWYLEKEQERLLENSVAAAANDEKHSLESIETLTGGTSESGGVSSLASRRKVHPNPLKVPLIRDERDHVGGCDRSNPFRYPTIYARVLAVTSYAIVMLIMSSLPLAMGTWSKLPYEDLVRAMTVFLVMMHAPISAFLLPRIGCVPVILFGYLCFGIGIGTAMGYHSSIAFTASACLFGIGWNNQFVTTTTLLNLAGKSSNNQHIITTNDMLVYAGAAAATLASAIIYDKADWTVIMYIVLGTETCTFIGTIGFITWMHVHSTPITAPLDAFVPHPEHMNGLYLSLSQVLPVGPPVASPSASRLTRTAKGIEIWAQAKATPLP